MSEGDYPDRLASIAKPPQELYYRGGIDTLNQRRNVAVIGSRHVSGLGREAAYRIGYVLGRRGIGVMNGLALGCDTYALRGALAAEDYPVVTLMGMVKIPGEFVKRLDAVMVGVWFFTLYALIGSSLYYGVDTARRVFGKRNEHGREGLKAKRAYERGKKRWFLAVTVAVYGMAYWFHMDPDVQAAVYEVFYLIGVPFLVIVPAGALILNRIRR